MPSRSVSRRRGFVWLRGSRSRRKRRRSVPVTGPVGSGSPLRTPSSWPSVSPSRSLSRRCGLVPSVSSTLSERPSSSVSVSWVEVPSRRSASSLRPSLSLSRSQASPAPSRSMSAWLAPAMSGQRSWLSSRPSPSVSGFSGSVWYLRSAASEAPSLSSSMSWVSSPSPSPVVVRLQPHGEVHPPSAVLDHDARVGAGLRIPGTSPTTSSPAPPENAAVSPAVERRSPSTSPPWTGIRARNHPASRARGLAAGLSATTK